MRQILFILGTRPEAIKLGPVICAAQKHSGLSPFVVATGQHGEVVDEILAAFDIDVQLHLEGGFTGAGTLGGMHARLLEQLAGVIAGRTFEAALVQGDTASAAMGALAAFYGEIPVGHVEAGLRTYDLAAPFPEEANRQIISRVARWHFVPTGRARENLLKEGVADGRIFLTGNPCVDALKMLEPMQQLGGKWKEFLANRRLVIITAHRRETRGTLTAGLVMVLKSVAPDFPDTVFLWPGHFHPGTAPDRELLSTISNVMISPPLEYREFTSLLRRADAVVTDSGGIQEEAAALSIPVLVTRENTERGEILESGMGCLVGTDPVKIEKQLRAALDFSSCRRLNGEKNIFGDGTAGEQIVDILASELTAFNGARVNSV